MRQIVRAIDTLRQRHLLWRYCLVVIALTHGSLGCGFHSFHQCHVGCELLGVECCASHHGVISKTYDAARVPGHDDAHPRCCQTHSVYTDNASTREASSHETGTNSSHRHCADCPDVDCVFARIDTQDLGDEREHESDAIMVALPDRCLAYSRDVVIGAGDRVDRLWRRLDRCPLYLRQCVLLI